VTTVNFVGKSDHSTPFIKTNIRTGKTLRLSQPKEPEEKSNPPADENIFLLWLCGGATRGKI